MLTRFRILMAVVIVGLIVSGITAFPLLWELNLMSSLLTDSSNDLNPDNYSGLTHWILRVREGLDLTYHDFPFLAYGTDWLAFGHIIIALFFTLPFIDPARYRGVLYIGIAACVLVIPLALICGPIREIPLYWQLVDCSFGVLCIFPLLYALRLSHRIEAQSTNRNSPNEAGT